MKARAWWLYLAATFSVGTLYFLGPTWARTGPVLNAIAASSVVAILVGTKMHRPRFRAPWYLFAAGLSLFLGGDFITYNYNRLFHVAQAPFPSLGDGLYVAVYPVLVTGLVILIRRRNRERDLAALLDSLIIVATAATLSWVFLMAPYAHDSTLSLSQKMTSIAYPLGDLMLLGMLARLAVGSGRRNLAFYLLALSIVSLLVADTVYTYILVTSTYGGSGSILDAGWGMFYVFWGAAALHPGMRLLTEPATDRTRRLQRTRLVLLAGCALVVPVVRIVARVRHLPMDDPVMLVANIPILVLVGLRMAGLVRRHEQAEERERAIRQASSALVRATDLEGILASVVVAVSQVAGDEAVARFAQVQSPTEPTDPAGAAGPTPLGETAATPVPSSAIPKRVLDDLIAGTRVELRRPDKTVASTWGFEDRLDTLILAPVIVSGELWGVLSVGGPIRLLMSGGEAVESLASQMALALERATLAEQLHRRQAEEWVGSLIKNATDIIALTEIDGTIRYLSPSIERVLGYSPDALTQTPIHELVHPEDRPRFLALVSEPASGPSLLESRWQHDSGEWLHIETQRTDLTGDPNVRAVVLNARDVSERRAFEEQLAHQAFHDSTTGLANRALFRDRVDHALERQTRGLPVAVIFMDIDDFKTINDTLGHATGDRLLAEVGERLRATISSADTAARMGGDEFAVLLEDASPERASEIANRIMESLEVPVRLDGKEAVVRASLGIAMGDTVGTGDAEDVLRNADVAMYMAKSQGKARCQVFEPEMHEAVLKRLELKADLQLALQRDEFILHYQPILELGTEEIAGVEALIRWMHPQRGLIPPLEFIPLAEESGVIVAIGRWVLEEACRQAIVLKGASHGGRRLTMSVNLSARQLQDDGLLDDIARILRETELDPALLVLEITESVMMADMDMSVRRLQELKRLGVGVAVDDFGTGYSSLNYIHQFPVDVLKVDKSFIDGLNQSGEVSALTATIIELARVLNLRPVAEGIETSQQLDRLVELGCDFGQGYLFAKPLDAASVETLISNESQGDDEPRQLAV